MKKYLLILAGLFMLNKSYAQLKQTTICPDVVIDILDGKINNHLFATSTIGEIKSKLPCYSSVEEETSSSKCGGTVFYKDKDLYFYTGRDYVEIREKFKGKLTVPLMGAARTNLFKWLGNPKIKDVNWDAFQMAYGTLVLYYKNGKVYKIQFSTKHTDSLTLCE